MPLDTSIPLQVQIPQFAEPIDPATRQYNALRQQALQQEMMRNQLIMQNTMEDRRREEANRRLAAATAAAEQRRKEELMGIYSRFGQTPAVIGQRGVSYSGTGMSTNPFEPVRNQLVQKGFLPQAADIAELENKTLTGAKAKAELPGVEAESRKKGVEADKAEFANAFDQMSVLAPYVANGAIPARVAADALLRHPVAGKLLSSTMTREEIYDFADKNPQAVAQILATPPDKIYESLAAPQKPELKNISGVGMVAVNPVTATGKRVTIDGQPLSATASEIPELKKGERWNAEKQRVEATEGSDIYIAQSQKHGKDFNAVNTVKSATDAALANIDKILAPENQDAFNSNFGGSTYLGSRYQPGKTQAIGAAIDSLKSTMKATGAQLMRSQGGAVGSITEREWPILEGMVASLKPEMPEQDARDVIANVRQRLANLNDISKETYDTTWGNTQYYKSNAGGKKTSDTTDSKSVFDAADAILGGK